MLQNNIKKQTVVPLNERSDEELLRELDELKKYIHKNSEIVDDGEIGSKIEEIEKILKKRRERKRKEVE